MYDSPNVRDGHRAAQRIEQLEGKLAELHAKLEKVGPATVNLLDSVSKLARLYDALSKGVEFLFDRSRASIPEFCEHRKQFAKRNAQPGPCECFSCRAERHDKQHGSGQASADATSDAIADAIASAIGGAVGDAIQQVLGPAGFEVNVESVTGDDFHEFMRRAQADGVRAAKEWLGLQQLKRGAEGERPEGRE